MTRSGRRGEIKARVYADMPDAYLAASDQGRLPAPARQVAYALRRITGLGDAEVSHVTDGQVRRPTWPAARRAFLGG